MKYFVFGIFVWFLVQLVFVSAVGEMHAAQRYASDATDAQFMAQNCSGVDGGTGFLAGLLFPLVDTNLVSADWCWNY